MAWVAGATAGIAVIVAGGWLALRGGARVGSAHAALPPQPPVAVATEGGSPPAPQERSTHHWGLADGADRPVEALVLSGSKGARLLVPLRAILAPGTWTWRGDALPIRVVHRDAVWGYALLAVDGPLPAGVEAMEATFFDASRARELRSIGPDGGREPVGIEGRRPDGRLSLAGRVPAGSALVDRLDRAQAYATDPGAALPLDPVIPWLAQAPGESLEDARRELRRQDPTALVADVEALLTDPECGLEQVIQGIADLSVAQRLAVEPALLERIHAALRRSCVAEVRLLARRDPGSAVGRGREALLQFPDDPDLLAVTTAAALAARDAPAAMDLLARLRAIDPTSADGLTDAVARVAAVAAERLSAAGDHVAACGLLERLVAVAPARAEVHAAHAGALERSGRLAEALVAAREAAARDPAFAPLVARLAEATATASDPTVVTIPYDPATGAIRADVRVGGQPVRMVVDTGASLTTVPLAVAQRLGLLSPTNQRVDLETVGGRVSGEMVRLPTLTIGSTEIRNVSAVALDLPGSLQGQGLLGLSALRRYDVRLDPEREVVVLRRRQGR